ncbi:uncharacterized protein LOC143071710 [Mytilus galloprovincialis]|uniref:uncharacterized protein LOC143071710 n=1 Tax=Mytilus galloprovincialis TaxID=29158 RepID=UPI003F7C71D3
MDSKCHNQYQLKEASVVLTKLDDKIFSQDTLTVLSDNEANYSTKNCENISANQNIEETQTHLSDNITQGSRKRRRKNEAPKRKVMRIDESYDVDIYKTYSAETFSLDSDSDVDYCLTQEKIHSNHYTTTTPGCGNNNANEGKQKDSIDSDKPKLYKTPIYIIKSRNKRSPDDSQPGITDPVTPNSHFDSQECDFIDVTTITDSEQSPVNSQDCRQITSIDKCELTCNVGPRSHEDSLRGHVNSDVQNEMINPVTSTTINSDTVPRPTTSENFSNKRKVVLEKETKLKKEKKVPNILSRAKRASKKPLKLKDTSSSLLEIRPKPHEHFKITTATRALLDETLNKHVVSPVNRPVFNSTLPIILKDASDKAKSNTDKSQTAPNSSSAKSVDTSSTSQVKTPTNVPLTVNKFALSTTLSTAIKPSMSKPQYSSRLRSKSGTKYIVRKDSIISTNISDFLEPAFSSKLTKECGSRLILKLPEKYLNETKFFKNFSPDVQSKQDTVYDSEVQGSSGLQISPVNVSPSIQINPVPKASPILKLTHSKEEYQYVDADERPIFLRSKGGLDDIMQELNMMNPELPKSPDVATKPEQTEANLQMIIPNKERKFSVKQITPTGLFLSNLKGRLMTHTKSSSKSTGSLSVQDITKPRIVQTFSMQQQVERNEKDRRLREGTIFNDLHKSDDISKRMKKFETSNFGNVKVSSKMNKLQMRLNKPLSAEELKGRSDNSTQRPQNSSNQQELNGNYLAGDQSKPNSALPNNGFQQNNQCDSSRLSKMELASTTYQTYNEGLLSVTQIKQEPVDPMEESNMKPEGEKYGKIDDVKPNVLLNDSKPVFVSTNDIKSERMDSNEDLKNGNEKNKLHTYKHLHEINQTDKKPIVELNKEGSMKTTEIQNGKGISIERKYEYKFDDHAYTRLEREASKSKGIESEMYTKQNEENSQKIPLTVQEFETDIISETLLKAQNSITSPPKPKPTSIPVYAVRCGERVVLFPASKTVTLGKPTKAEILPKLVPTPTKSPKQVSPSKNINKISMKKHQLERQKMNFVKKCALTCSQESNAKKLELDVNDLITRDFKHIIGKRPKNSMKHMCAVVVQITRSLDNKFTFSKDVLAFSFTNGSNPTLVRWHTDGIHAALVTFNNKGKIQHLTVDRLLSGFYCLSLKNDPVIRKSRTFEGLLTSTLPNEDLLHSEKDFLAVGEIKSIMDPTLRKPDIKPSSGMTLTEALSDVLPKDLMQMYNPAVSDRSYIPKVHDKSWYSLEKFETFTRTYGRKRGYHTNGCRLPGEEVVN